MFAQLIRRNLRGEALRIETPNPATEPSFHRPLEDSNYRNDRTDKH